MTILTFINHYLPGYKAGGPMRTLAYTVGHLGDEFDFRIVTSDRDYLDTEPYPDIPANEWVSVGKAQVFYLSPERKRLSSLRTLIRETPHEILYLNSSLDPNFTAKPLLLRLLRQIPRKPLVIAPRGEFSPKALAIKSNKKRLYHVAARATGLFRDALWQAATDAERQEIPAFLGETARYFYAPDLPAPIDERAFVLKEREKLAGTLNVAFLGRIAPIKNLDGALNALTGMSEGRIAFDIYGPIDDPNHWEACQHLIACLPESVSATYKGALPNPQVAATLTEYDVFFAPSHVESFGHAILEALLAGCPVLTSDRTPWRNLAEAKAGRDVALDDAEGYRNALRDFLQMDAPTLREWREGARRLAEAHCRDERVIAQNRELFWSAVR